MNRILSSVKYFDKSKLLARNGNDIEQIRKVSVFLKKQSKIDPEQAKLRELRMRRKLEKEIRQLKLHSKKPKPIMELTIDIKSAKNIDERYRPKSVLFKISDDEMEKRYIALRDYSFSRAALMRLDEKWIRQSIEKQEKALKELKLLSLDLYEAAIQPDHSIDDGIILNGPTLTPPLTNYEPPDGDYIDITKEWV
ncbi:unnamed protein product [Dracunculus medinensis]|uniref:Large ribosomal subunit protein mL40 n=1 Tax=Dracunculus medinensis TaxID=318479 RepID=A0A0N4U7Q8_DRAME|nr:unnamed protein product [Dracunculus medinensis]